MSRTDSGKRELIMGEKNKASAKRSIIYISSAVPEELYNKCISRDKMTDQQSQKFNRAMINGFAECGFHVYPVSYRQRVSAEGGTYAEKGIDYRIIRHREGKTGKLGVFFEAVKSVSALIREHRDAVVVADILAITMSYAAVTAAALHRRERVGIVTDVPGIYDSPGLSRTLDRLVIGFFTKYIFLTEAMNGLLNRAKRPYTVMEGLYLPKEALLTEKAEREKEDKFTLMYAGSLHEKYGAVTLTEAMRHIDRPDIRLELYGTGDSREKIIEAAARDERIIYHGVAANCEVMRAERAASLLINPRSRNELFTQYSFPSKTIEYMGTGVPVLMQELPGMPEEYKKFVYLYSGDSGEELARAITEVYGIDEKARHELGARARKFITENKNAAAQCRRTAEALGL